MLHMFKLFCLNYSGTNPSPGKTGFFSLVSSGPERIDQLILWTKLRLCPGSEGSPVVVDLFDGLLELLRDPRVQGNWC